MKEKTIFAIIVIVIVAYLQSMAWIMHFNGTVFAFTSLVIGLTAGAILGFKFK